MSDLGEVRALDRIVVGRDGVRYHRSGHPMKLTEARNNARKGRGYLVVNLRKNHIADVTPVHRIVAETFIDNPLGLPTVNHKDGNKHNNRVDNLEWVSYSENNMHALEHGLRHPRGTAILQITKDGTIVAGYKSTYEASRQTGLKVCSISHCLNGRQKQYAGYIWKRKSECETTIPTGSTPEDELPAEAQRAL